MTRPIYEPTSQRQIRKLGFSADQLFRRPAPQSSTTAVVNLPIDLRNPSANSYFSLRNLATSTPFGTWAFVKDVDSNIMGVVILPASFNTIAVSLYICSSTSATGNVVIGLSTRAAGVGDNPVGTFTAETNQTVAVTQSLSKVTFSSLGSSPAAEDMLAIVIRHLGTDGNDTLAVDLLMHAAILEVT